jgi:hypothetical protein
VLLLGCLLPACADDHPAPPAEAPRAPAPEAGKRFDPAVAGTIVGTVRWKGPIPQVEPFRSVADPLADWFAGPGRQWPNPNAPRIDPETGGVGSAVVFLRSIEPEKGRPWDHPPARVEVRDWRLHVRQGAGERISGFVRAGDVLEVHSLQERLCTVQGRGAAFFTLALTEPNQVRSRRLQTPGVVELMSGTGQFWMRAYLFVSRHPYLAHTDARGQFRLDRVPPGPYDLVAWHPDWRVVEHERNPELYRVQQVRFRPAFEVVGRVRVQQGQVTTSDLLIEPR